MSIPPKYLGLSPFKYIQDLETVVAKQTVELANLNTKLTEADTKLDSIRKNLVCIGGPLNDNSLGYSVEQLRLFRRIYNIIQENEL